MNRERQFTNLKQETWGLASGIQTNSQIVVEIFPAGIDAKQDQNVRFFRGLVNNEIYFLKLFVGSKWQADAEVINTTVLSSAKVEGIVPILESESSGNNTLIIYPYIGGESFHSVVSSPSCNSKVLENTGNVLRRSKTLEGFKIFRIPEAFLKQYPFPETLFTDPIFRQINQAYEPFWKLREAICTQNPGHSMDRTPRNILITETGEINQIDFELVYFDSPLFDLAKLMRNGPESGATEGLTVLDATKAPESIFSKLNSFSQDEESKLVNQFLEIALSGQDRSKAVQSYWQVSAHTHIFYISKYLRRYREAKVPEVKGKAYRRLVFHFAGLFSLKEKLIEPYLGRKTAGVETLTGGVEKKDIIRLFDLYRILAQKIN